MLERSDLVQFALQLTQDAKFLKDHNIMDYSLLLGVHSIRSDEEHAKFLSSYDPEDLNRIGSAWERYNGGLLAHDYKGTPLNEVYYIGIIDVLQRYNLKKEFETIFKSVAAQKSQISAVDPRLYAGRFVDFMMHKVVI